MRVDRASRVMVTLAWLVGSAAIMVAAMTEPPLTLEGKLDLPDVQGRIDHLSIDLKTNRLFMAALGNDTVEVIDVHAGRRVHTIRGLAEPQGLLFVPSTNRLFVANGKDGTVRLFDGTTLAPLQTIALGDDADNVRFDARSGRVWVGYGDGALAALDPDGKKVADIPVGRHPESFQLEQNGTRIFVNVPDARKIAVVDRGKGTVVANWKTGDASDNFPMTLDERDKRLFVVCRQPARVLALNTDDGAIVASMTTVGDADDVFYDAAARRIYVSGGDGAIVAYRQDDPDHYTDVGRFETVKGARTSFFSPDLRRLFLAVRRQGAAAAGVWTYAVGGGADRRP
jgi:DNA-binding beta-propeller fold protein YncE